MAPPSFATIQSVVDKIAEVFAAEGITAEVRLGSPANKAIRKDVTIGQVVIIPATAVVGAPRFTGTQPVTQFGIKQELEIRISAKAPKNTTDPSRQWGDDLSQCEALRNVVMHVGARHIPGFKAGGTQNAVATGENVQSPGIELRVSVDLDSVNLPYTPVIAPADTTLSASCAFVGPNETVECCESDVPAP